MSCCRRVCRSVHRCIARGERGFREFRGILQIGDFLFEYFRRAFAAALQLRFERGDAVVALDQTFLQRFVARFEALHLDRDFRIGAGRAVLHRLRRRRSDRDSIPIVPSLTICSSERARRISRSRLTISSSFCDAVDFGLRQPIAHRLQFTLQRSDALIAIAQRRLELGNRAFGFVDVALQFDVAPARRHATRGPAEGKTDAGGGGQQRNGDE